MLFPIFYVFSFLVTINNNLNGVILWSNPGVAIGTEFAAQTVTLSDDISNYAYYEIEYCRSLSSSTNRLTRYKTGKIPVGAHTRLQLFSSYFFDRFVHKPSGNTLEFTDAGRYESYGSNTVTVYNTICVPIYVIGYKTL